MKKKIKSQVETWITRTTQHQLRALENASRHFDGSDSLTINLLEGIYGIESSFGARRRRRNIPGAAGDFQFEAKTARRLGLTVESGNDQRFDVDDASAAAAKYLKMLDGMFEDGASLGHGVRTIQVADSIERVKFVLAAYNAGEGRIAKAQQLASIAQKYPELWADVREFLTKAGASLSKTVEVQDYVTKVEVYAAEFSEKSKADKSAKHMPPLKLLISPKGAHWITKGGRHILIGP